MRWSQLKSLIEDLFDPDLGLEVFCTVQRGERGSIGRYWFMLEGENIWDYPKNVSHALRENRLNDDAADMGRIMREYLEVPKDQLISKNFEGDPWGLAQILKAADRRIGKRRLLILKEATQLPAALKIINKRLRE